MWADTVLRAEQQHLLQMMAWAALSIIAGTGLLAVMAMRRRASPLLLRFGQLTAAIGFVTGVVAAARWRGSHLRDLAGAARLERMTWLSAGLDVGLAAVGVTLAACGWWLVRRGETRTPDGGAAVIGAGIGVVIQGLALLILDLQLAASVSR